MSPQRFLITKKEVGLRLDCFLAAALARWSRSRWQHLIEKGAVLLNGQVVKASYRLQEGDQILCFLPRPKHFHLLPEAMSLEIIYEDADLLVVFKPRGLLVHPVTAEDKGTLVHGLLAHCATLAGEGHSLRPGIVHRLDQDTSGLLLVAKKEEVARNLGEQFQANSVLRKYLVLVQGVLSEPGGIIEAPLGRDPRQRQKMAVHPRGKRALTKYWVEERFADYSLLSCQLITGRTHQLRVHLAYLEHPVVGDAQYGLVMAKDQELGLEGQALHALTLGFRHPGQEKWLEFTVKPPQDFRRALQKLGSKWEERSGLE